MTRHDAQRRKSRYGATFDQLADRWAALESEHDQVHPDRGECGGLGACSMMARAHDLREAMRGALEVWRTGAVPMTPLHRARLDLLVETIRSASIDGAATTAINDAMVAAGNAYPSRTELYAGLKQAVELGRIVHPDPRGRFYATEHAPTAGSLR